MDSELARGHVNKLLLEVLSSTEQEIHALMQV